MENLTKTNLRIIKTALKFTMEQLSNDLKKSIKTDDYDEIIINIQCLNDYYDTLMKIVRGLKNE